MYHEEKIGDDGLLYFRGTPKGEWRLATGHYADAVNAMMRLKDEQRKDVMRFFCRGCGCDNPMCQCDNDE